jgi:uncharacterized circularly permuted ATP-grasp superfamily protein/uncharacterized alpha-E superfamily protein
VPDLLAGYRPHAQVAGRFDEMIGDDGAVRPHWSVLAELLGGTGTARVGERIGALERDIREGGLTYNRYADPEGVARPWVPDALPLVLPAQEWAFIEAAMTQRARLLNTLLADLYGPQTLLASGLIPPRLVLGHRGFQRAACGSQWAGGQPLLLCATDLARSPDGRWWVVADRTQAPSGAGYALDNRLSVSRVFPDLFSALHVERLAGFFAALRDTLRDRAPRGDGPPLSVLLTPGPWNETYSEHSLLARYLGLPLVEGGDLTVRDGKVWLKGVAGLQRVHAILRRQDDDFCDPLELRADSALGVPGLVDCARRGTVLMANAIGSGVLESGALLGFLPRLCEHLLGESLQMPSVASWWMGEPAALADALSRADRLVFHPTDPGLRGQPVFGQDLDRRGLRALAVRIRRNPADWVAQEQVMLSQAPVFEQTPALKLDARAVMLRVFSVATRDGWSVMPGGLTRVAGVDDRRIVATQRGGGSKDTWVLSAAPVSLPLTLLRSTVGPDDLVRSAGASLSSRAAENLFWFGRYAERCEAIARFLRVAWPRLSVDGDDEMPSRSALLNLARSLGLAIDAAAVQPSLQAAVFEPRLQGGLRDTIDQLHRVAFGLRERLSVDHWRALSGLQRDPGFDGFRDLAQALALLDRTVVTLATCSGFVLDGMTRDAGWRFVSAGRRIERLRAISAAVCAASRHGRAGGLDWLLEFADSSITYRSRYLGTPEWLPVLDLLVADDTNPRSVASQLQGLSDAMQRIDRTVGSDAQSLMPAVLAGLGPWADPARLQPGEPFETWLDAVFAAAAQCSDRLSMHFFSLARDLLRATLAA